MIIKHQDGKTTTPAAGSLVKGLKIKTITLDSHDLNSLLARSSDSINKWLTSLASAMYVPKPGATYIPIDEDNSKLKSEGKDYICRVSFQKIDQ
jgi:hypothetical protein